jgi:hypothetical protein
MSAQHEFYLQRVEEARIGAEAATLDNVRERWQRSEASWSMLAARSALGAKMHAQILADKARERAALLADA